MMCVAATRKVCCPNTTVTGKLNHKFVPIKPVSNAGSASNSRRDDPIAHPTRPDPDKRDYRNVENCPISLPRCLPIRGHLRFELTTACRVIIRTLGTPLTAKLNVDYGWSFGRRHTSKATLDRGSLWYFRACCRRESLHICRCYKLCSISSSTRYRARTLPRQSDRSISIF